MRYWKYFLIALLVKASITGLKLLETQTFAPKSLFPQGYAVVRPDTWDYLTPIEHWIKEGVYTPDFRMPGYGFFYLLFRWWLPPPWATTLMVFVQTLLDAIATIVLASLSQQLFKWKQAFYWVFWIYLFSIYVSIYNAFLLTESLCTHLLIFSFAFLYWGDKKGKVSYFFISGLLLAWAIFLKPVVAPLWLLWGGYLVYCCRFNSIYFLLPFLVAESLWVLRNYNVHHQWRFFVNSSFLGHPQTALYYRSLVRFVQSWGGSVIFWRSDAEINFFLSEKGPLPPNYIYTSVFNYDSLLQLRSKLQLLQTLRDTQRYKRLERLVVASLERYRISLQEERPFLYYIIAPLRLLWNLTGIYLGCIHPLGFRLTEPRFLVLAYPFLCNVAVVVGGRCAPRVLTYLRKKHRF